MQLINTQHNTEADKWYSSSMQISVLQWNIWVEEDINDIVNLLRQEDADVVCLQELTLGKRLDIPDTVSFVADSLGYEYYSKDMLRANHPWRQVNAIFSKYPITNRHHSWVRVPDGSGTHDDEHHAYVEVTLDINGLSATIATTHLSYTDGFIETEAKKTETDKLVMLLKNHNKNLVFSGDLNSPPNSYTTVTVSKLLKLAGPPTSENTWTTKPFSYNGFSENDVNWRLDYIFTSQDVSVISSKIVKTGISDHLPVYALVDLSD